MIDRYSVERIIDGHCADAVKTAERERLASQAAATAPAPQPVAVRAAAKLRALVLTGARRGTWERMEGC
ncbi:MAG TPA: hypothetical protein VJT33_05325 [bacterium]|nr:hypothetical protein [bacterium]